MRDRYRVTPEMREAVLRRDGCCVLIRLDPEHRCRTIWGDYHDPRNLDKLTIEHVKTESMMGRRAPSDLDHMVAMCAYSNVAVSSRPVRDAIRGYLVTVNATESELRLMDGNR